MNIIETDPTPSDTFISNLSKGHNSLKLTVQISGSKQHSVVEFSSISNFSTKTANFILPNNPFILLNHIIMKINALAMRLAHKPIAMLLLVGFLFFNTNTQAQSNSNLAATQSIDFVGIESADLSNVQWKEKSELQTILGAEKSKYESLAGTFGTGSTEKNTYSSFAVFLGDLKSNLLTSAPPNAIVLALKKLDNDYQTSVESLKPDIASIMYNLYPGLIESLQNQHN
jgi:hypothetical protein